MSQMSARPEVSAGRTARRSAPTLFLVCHETTVGCRCELVEMIGDLSAALTLLPPATLLGIWLSWAYRVGSAFCCSASRCSGATATGPGSPTCHVSGHVFRTSHGRAEQARYADAAVGARAAGRPPVGGPRAAARAAWPLHPRRAAALPAPGRRTAFLFRGPWRRNPSRAVHSPPALA